MRISETAIGVALLLLSQTLAFKHNHGHGLTRLDKIERKHSHMHKHSKAQAAARLNDTPSRDEDAQNEIKRALQGGSSATCKFPTDVGLVAVTPGSGNGGWAMSPDQSCTAGSYCPYACPAGQISMQWDPSVTSYTYPGCQVCRFDIAERSQSLTLSSTGGFIAGVMELLVNPSKAILIVQRVLERFLSSIA